MYFNIDWKNDKSPALTANNLNWLQTQFEEMVKQILEKKKDKTIPLGIRVDIDPNEAKVGEIFYLTGDDTQQKLSFTSGKTFYAFLQDPSGRLRYNYNGVEWRFKMVDKETACYLLQVGTEQEDDAGHGTPPGVSDNPYNPANKEYTIYYYTNGGTTIENQVVAGGSVITAPAGETTKAGYDFEGWFLDTDYTTPVEFPFEVYGNVNFYAKWVETAKTYYTVTFITNGGVAIQDMSIAEGEFINEPETTREGYDFVGWYLDSAFATDMVIFPLQINADTTLYAKWEDATVYKTITYIYGVDDYSTIQVPVGTYATLETPTKDGYDFNGWYLENTYENKVESPMLVEDNTVLYAKWTEAIKYCTITYICPVCKITVASPTQVVKGSQLTNVTYGVEEGYTPEGLYLDANYTQELQLPMVVENDLTIYIKAVSSAELSINVRYIKWSTETLYGSDGYMPNCFCELQAFDSSGVNVALNKPSYMSWEDESAATTTNVANNGLYSDMQSTSYTNYYTSFEGARVRWGINPTLHIDLETPVQLSSIRYWGYWKSADYITRDIIWVSEDNVNWYKVEDTENTGGSELGHTVEVKIKEDTECVNFTNNLKDLGIRYIRVKSLDDTLHEGIQLAEIEAYATSTGDTNLASKKPVRYTNLSGEQINWSTSTYLTDGKCYIGSNNLYAFICKNDTYAEVDLGSIQNIGELIIAPDMVQFDVYTGFQVEVSRDGINYYKLCNRDYKVGQKHAGSSKAWQYRLTTPFKFYLKEIAVEQCEVVTTPTFK